MQLQTLHSAASPDNRSLAKSNPVKQTTDVPAQRVEPRPVDVERRVDQTAPKSETPARD